MDTVNAPNAEGGRRSLANFLPVAQMDAMESIAEQILYRIIGHKTTHTGWTRRIGWACMRIGPSYRK